MNNSDINIADILRDCPQGTLLYSRIAGKLELQQVLEKGCDYHPIQAEVIYENENPKNDRFASFTDTGQLEQVAPQRRMRPLPFPRNAGLDQVLPTRRRGRLRRIRRHGSLRRMGF